MEAISKFFYFSVQQIWGQSINLLLPKSQHGTLIDTLMAHYSLVKKSHQLMPQQALIDEAQRGIDCYLARRIGKSCSA